MKENLVGRTPKFYGAVVIGERGQIVIPAEARRDMNFTAGEKLIVMGGPQGLMIAKAESILQFLGKTMEQLTRFESMIKTDNEPVK
ncbi:MAG: AbrB/MazE/SpoVT family DNA-binding domain-containing protein [Chloroflexi bacterium]|nr:AbrB/MazE/SpoVT family DNA-binding domain-containing protein [Chloroflexota bacterium]